MVSRNYDAVAETVSTPAKGNGHAQASTLHLLSLEEFVIRPSISSLVDGIWPPQGIVVAFGPPKEGKTFTMTDLSMHAAHDASDWHGFKIRRPLRIGFMAGEGTIGLKLRLHAWRQHHDTAQMLGNFRVLPESLSLPDRAGEVVEALRTFSPDIVVADTLNAYFGAGDENSTADMTRFCSSVRYIRDELRCTVVIIHHTGLGNQTRERGSIVLRASADVVIQIGRDENDPSLVGFQVVAARDMETMAEPIALHLRRVETDWLDDDGKAMTTCIVEAAHSPVSLAGRGGKPLGGRQRELIDIAREFARARGGKGEVIIPRLDISQEAQRRGIPKQTISSAWEPLEARGYWRRLEPGSIAIQVSG